MSRFQKIVVAAWLGVVLLVFAGSIVRSTGSGLGCPDWPKCYGCLIPPTSADQVDFESLDIEKFKAKAERHGGNPDNVTAESLRRDFNPVATWIEFINRLITLPVAIFTLLVFSFSVKEAMRGRPSVFLAGMAGVAIVLINAIMGARIVYSGLSPGVITVHMALTMLLLCVFVYAGWRGQEKPWTISFVDGRRKGIVALASCIFFLTLAEVVMGSQVRELTDELAKSHKGEERSLWIHELEQSWIYLIHRSFSWLIVLGTLAFAFLGKKALTNGFGWIEKVIFGLVLLQMILGVVMSQFAIYPVVQVAHVLFTALLLSAQCLWLLGAWKKKV